MEENKSTFKERLNLQIHELELKMDKLKLKAKAASDDAKEKYKEVIDDLDPKVADAKTKLREFGDSADDAWDDVKEGAASVWEQMKTTFNNIKDRFGDDDDNDEGVASSTDE